MRKYTYQCMCLGETVFSSIVYGHEFVNFSQEAITSEYWKCFNDHMLMSATSMRVYQIPGWARSRGIADEINYAQRLTIPVEYVTCLVLAEEQPQ